MAVLALGVTVSGCKSSGTAFNPPGGVSTSYKYLYVANAYADTVDAFLVTATGDVAPSISLTGSTSLLAEPRGIAFGASGEMYVSSNGYCTTSSSDSILVYAAGASGDPAPVTDINGSNTGLCGPDQVAVGSNGEVYVANEYNGNVLVFAAGANGDVAPTSTIDLECPYGVTVRGTTLYVTDACREAIYIFENGSTSPTTTISGSNTTLYDPKHIALDSAGNMYVANEYGNSVLVFAAGSSGNVSPEATISGSNTDVAYPYGIAVGNGKIYVTAHYNSQILVFSETANGNVAPLATVSGSSTTLDYPKGVALH